MGGIDLSPGSDISLYLKLALVVLCSFAISSNSILMRVAEHGDSIAFSPIAASFFSEAIKMLVAIGMMVYSPHTFKQLREVNLRNRIILSVPALLYVLMNNLRFFIVKAVNPGLLQVLWNLKIVVIALIYQIPPFSRRLSLGQWGGAALLVVGSAVADYSQWSTSSTDGASNSGGTLGLILVISGLFLAGVAGVSCEYAYKFTAPELDFPAQAFVLYAHGALFNLVAFSLWGAYGVPIGGLDAQGSGSNLWASLIHGFDVWAWVAVISVAFTGFLVGLIFKYIDTVAQVMCELYFIE
jgi:hypothetical protein